MMVAMHRCGGGIGSSSNAVTKILLVIVLTIITTIMTTTNHVVHALVPGVGRKNSHHRVATTKTPETTFTTSSRHHTKQSAYNNNNENNEEETTKTLFVHRRQWLTAVSAAASLLPLILPLSPLAAEAKDLSEEYRQGTAALSLMESQAPVPDDAYVKLPSGLIYADLYRDGGSGGKSSSLSSAASTAATAKVGSRVNLQWVLRKSNGYFVDSSASPGTGNSVPFIFTVGDGTAIAGVDEGVRGMTVKSVRRLLIPPSLAYANACLDDGCPGPLPVGYGPRQQMRRVQTIRKDVPGEYVFLEIKLTRLQ